MEIKKPFNLQKWIADNRHLLKPPVGNKNLYVESEDYIVMIVAGPNARKDYHYNETEELFYQIEGEIIVKTQQNMSFRPSFLCFSNIFYVVSREKHTKNIIVSSIFDVF